MSQRFIAEKKLTLLDYAFDLLERTDFTLILALNNPPGVENLRAGAESAMKRFPISGSRIKHRRWRYEPQPFQTNGYASIESFVDAKFDLRTQNPVKQLLTTNQSGAICLVTRFHHAAADGLSAALWLGHQLSVAYGLVEPHATTASFSDLPLRRSSSSVRRSEYAHSAASDPLWTTNYIPSGPRRWLTINFPADELRHGCRRARGFTYNDLLAACAMTVFSQWNQTRDGRASRQKIGLWLPMNVRAHSGEGFGNGTSRVRVYARFPRRASLSEKAREVRKQIAWSTTHGEWVVPELPLFTRLPRPIVAPLLNGYLKQPNVDMATGVFSHVDRWAGDATAAFANVTRIECIGPLHPRQHLAINGATHQGQTWLTFTYDAGLLALDHARELAQMFEEQIASARKEFA
jgi:hypothetical protein